MAVNTAHNSPDAERRAASLSKRFVRNGVWALIICAIFLAGQGLRYGYKLGQLALISQETEKLYQSVLGQDIGNSPFGRLQYEQGKLSANLRVGMDPLNLLAALSRPAVESLRIEAISLDGMKGRVRGFFGPNVGGFDRYINTLTDDDTYYFTLENREEVFGGIIFSLLVEPQ